MKEGKKSTFEKVEAEIFTAAGEYVKEKVTRKFIKLGEFSILALLALMLISIGLANLIAFYFPEINNGLNYIFLGLLFLIAGFLIKA